jgi:hypothetical protein
MLGLAGAAIAATVECDDVYCFTPVDFSQDQQLTGICITGLPDSKTGTVMLGSRVLRPGDILTVEQITQMTFVPLMTQDDQDATLTYLPIYENRVAKETVMTMSIRGKEDKAPVALDSSMETYKNLANEGKLNVTDPEGKKLTYSLTRQPKRGTVTIREDGTFLYTPKKNKVGTDSFTYTAVDPAGKVSREATVTVQILKPADGARYSDTSKFTAEWLRNTGIFEGEKLGDDLCFQPHKTVSRGEFMAMLVKVLDLPMDDSATYTGFTDDAPNWLKPYLAAALRAGVTENWPDGAVFAQSEAITGTEAALLVQNSLDLTVSVLSGKDESDLPTWAATAMQAMAENGIHLDIDTMTRAEAADLLYQISKMK